MWVNFPFSGDAILIIDIISMLQFVIQDGNFTPHNGTGYQVDIKAEVQSKMRRLLVIYYVAHRILTQTLDENFKKTLKNGSTDSPLFSPPHASGISHQYSASSRSPDDSPLSQDLLANAPFSPIDTEPSTTPAFFKEANRAPCWTSYCAEMVPSLDEDIFTSNTSSSDSTVVPRPRTRRLSLQLTPAPPIASTSYVPSCITRLPHDGWTYSSRHVHRRPRSSISSPCPYSVETVEWKLGCVTLLVPRFQLQGWLGGKYVTVSTSQFVVSPSLCLWGNQNYVLLLRFLC